MMYYSSDSPSSLITESVCLVGKGRLKERCGLEPQTNFFFCLRNWQKLVPIRFGCWLDSRIYSIILRPPVTVEQDDKEIALMRNQCGSLIQH